MEMSVHIDNQPFKVKHKQQGQKKPGLLSCSTIVRMSHWSATLLPITLSPGLGCLVCTYSIQIWS